MQQLWGSFGVIFNKNKVILQQRNDPGTPFHKKWAFPGGIIQFGEHPEGTLVRKIREEIDIHIEIASLLPVIHNFIEDDKQLLLLYYLCFTNEEELHNYDDQGDILKVKWFDFNSIKKKQLLRGADEVLDQAYKLIK